jgi:inward rectifier potassium channel
MLKQKIKNEELGFGTKTNEQNTRYINKDGSFNIDRTEISRWKSLGVYHALVAMSWRKFNLIVLIYFVLVNVLFACLYYFTDMDGLMGVKANTELDKFLEAFFFSTQTFSTVGFGRISPGAHITSTIAAIESLFGLLGFAIATGLLYGRFSRPVARILYSNNAIIAPFKDGLAFQFRIANQMRNSQISDLHCKVSVAKMENENGNQIRRFKTLDLEISNIMFFPMTWTLNHPIDENSPLYGMSLDDLKKADAEIMIWLSGFDDTFSQTVSTRYSYTCNEIIYGAKWVSVFGKNKSGSTTQDLTKLSEYESVKI